MSNSARGVSDLHDLNIPAGNQDKAKPFGGQLFRKNNPFIKNYDESNISFIRKYK